MILASGHGDVKPDPFPEKKDDVAPEKIHL
jgi:hypothetical protein